MFAYQLQTNDYLSGQQSARQILSDNMQAHYPQTQKHENRKQFNFHPSEPQEQVNQKVVKTIVEKLGYSAEDVISHVLDKER